MSEPRIVHPSDVESKIFPGGGKAKRLVMPQTVGSKELLVGTVEVRPGESPHRWHTHTKDKGEGYEVSYHKDFEEAYFIVRGSGTVYWKVRGEQRQAEVREGDAIYFPAGIVEHQLVNTGDTVMFMVYAGTPMVRVLK